MPLPPAKQQRHCHPTAQTPNMCHCTAPEANEESVSAGNLAGLIEQFPPNERKLRIGSDDALDHCDAGAGSPRGFAGEDRRSMPPAPAKPRRKNLRTVIRRSSRGQGWGITAHCQSVSSFPSSSALPSDGSRPRASGAPPLASGRRCRGGERWGLQARCCCCYGGERSGQGRRREPPLHGSGPMGCAMESEPMSGTMGSGGVGVERF
jgi:hypothetical protein